MDVTPRFASPRLNCPLCTRAALVARATECHFIDCLHCSTFLVTDEGRHSLLNDPLPAREVANIASYNWEWSPCWDLDNGLCELNEFNVRRMGKHWRKKEHHRFCQVLLRVLYNTYRRKRFMLEFDDPMYLGMTASVSPDELREFVLSAGRSYYLPVIEDHGRAIRTCISEESMALLSIHLQVAPGISRAFNLDASRKRVA